MNKIPWWAWAIGLGGIGFLLYKGLSKAGSAASSATNAVSTAIANAWLSLPFVGLQPNMTILGKVILPSGSQVPLSSLQSGQIRTDQTGNVYANILGTIYQLAPSDSSGNYPATLIGPAPAGA